MNWTAKLAQIFVKNGRLSLLLVIALFTWGIISFFATPKQYNPKITAPAFQIKVLFPGASKKEVLEQVTKPLENIISDIPNVEDIFSVTQKGGSAVVSVNFTVGEDVDSAKITLQDRIQSNFDRVPLGIEEPLIQSLDPDDVPVMTIALTSDNIGPVQLRKFAFSLRDRLRTVEGASNIEVVGGRRRELGILVNPVKIARVGAGIVGIENALRRSNLYLPSGKIKSSNEYIPVEATSIVEKPEDLANIVVVTGDYGQILLKDVARIEERTEEVEEYVRHTMKHGDSIETSKSVVLLSIAKLKGTNISDVTTRVREDLVHLRKTFIPKSVNTEVIVNEGRVARKEIQGLISNLFAAVFIVVVVLLIFLDMRAALLVAVTIPLTLASVFGVGLLAGQNINRITLFALILSLGLLVDSATVVIENIVRRIREAKGARKKATIVSAVNDVGMGLFMSTVTTVLAFIPMAFVTGMMGPYMGPIPFFLPTALIVSLLISITITPWMASVVLKERHTTKERKRLSIPEHIKKPYRKTAHTGKRIFEKYHSYLHVLLINAKQRRIFLVVIAVLIMVSLALPAVTLVKFRMLPKADREQFFIYLDMPSGTSLDVTLDVTEKLETFLLREKNIHMVQSYIGRPPVIDFNGLFRGVSERRDSNQATLRVGLTIPETRDLTSEELVQELRPRLLEHIKIISPGREVAVKMVEDPPGPPVMSTYLVRVQGYDEKYLQKVAKDLYPEISRIKEVVDTDTSIPEDTQTIEIHIDHQHASKSRISPVRIVETLQASYEGKVLGIYHNQNNIEQEHITLRMDKKFRIGPETLDKIYIFNDLGIEVPLKDFVTINRVTTVNPVRRENRMTTVYLYGDMAHRSVTYAAIDFLSFLHSYALPDGKGILKHFSLFGASYERPDGTEVRITLGGEWELTLEVFRDLGIAMAVAIFLIYFVLVAQFGSFREPVIIMSTIPLSLIGVLPGFMVLNFINNQYFSATSMIGVIALAGIAVNNSIILLEYVNSLKGKGMALEDALLDAARVRFRPIMLTTITTMLGSLTIASDPVWSGLAYAIFFGLGVSSFLTLLVFPVMYYIFRGRGYWEKCVAEEEL